MRVVVGSTLLVYEPTRELQEWAKDHLMVPNPEYAKKLRMGFWVGKTPKTIALYEWRGSTLVLPFGVLRHIWDMVSGYIEGTDFGDRERVDYGEQIELYPYQRDAVEVLKSRFYGILQSPAGSGKTQMGIALIMQIQRKALWITHTADLLNQSKERAERYIPKELIGTITEGKVNIGEGITFGTIQTLARMDLSQYMRYWDCIIVDECHRVAGSPTAVTQFCKVLNGLSASHKYGLSATVHRADGMIAATHALLGPVVHTVPDEAVAERVMQMSINPIPTGYTMQMGCLNPDGTLNYTKLINSLCEDEGRSELIGKWLIREKGHSCLILSDRIEHLTALMEALPENMRRDAAIISGRTQTKKGKLLRTQAVEAMRSGEKRYLFATYALAKEGLDIPCLDRLFLTTPQKDYAIVTQSIGRVARTYPGKGEPVVHDFVDDIGILVKAWKKRRGIYKRNGCRFVEK